MTVYVGVIIKRSCQCVVTCGRLLNDINLLLKTLSMFSNNTAGVASIPINLIRRHTRIKHANACLSMYIWWNYCHIKMKENWIYFSTSFFSLTTKSIKSDWKVRYYKGRLYTGSCIYEEIGFSVFCVRNTIPLQFDLFDRYSFARTLIGHLTC